MRLLSGFLLLVTVLVVLLSAPTFAAAKKKPGKVAAPKTYPPCVYGLIPVGDGNPKSSGSGWIVNYNFVDPSVVSLIRKSSTPHYGAIIGIVQGSYRRQIKLKSPLLVSSKYGEGRDHTLARDTVDLVAHFEIRLRHWSGAVTKEWRKEPLNTLPGTGNVGSIDRGTKPQSASFSAAGLKISGVPGISWSSYDQQYILCRGPNARALAVELRANWAAYGEGNLNRIILEDPDALPLAIQKIGPYRQQAKQAMMTMLNSLRWNSAAFAGLKPGPPEIPTEATIRLAVNALTSMGTGPVEQARCTVQMPDGRKLTGNTGATGETTITIPLRDPTSPLRVKVVAVQANEATVYHVGGVRYPSLLRAGCPAIWPTDRTVILKPATSFEGADDIALPLCVADVNVSQWNSVTMESAPASLPVMIKNARQKAVLQAEPEAFQAIGELRMLIPPRDVWQIENLNIVAFDRVEKGRRDAAFVPAPDAGEPVSVQLDVNDLAWRIQRMRERLIALFMPIVGVERASDLANVRVNFVTESGARYLDGVIQLEQSYDPTDDGPSETLLHEWSHHIAAVLAPDPGVEGRVGGAHELWGRAQYRETAWDEARAHFLAQELARAFRAPRTTDLLPAQATDVANLQPPDGGGGQVEGVIATALLDHYQRTGYGTPDRALADFLAVEGDVRQRTGRPPRTVEEFISGKAAYMDSRKDTPPAQRQDLAPLAERYRLLAAP